jgi:hypothetical protein
MTAQPSPGLPKPGSLNPLTVVLLTPTETAKRLQVSLSWLAKARMRRGRSALHQDRSFHSIQRIGAAALDESASAIVDQ